MSPIIELTKKHRSHGGWIETYQHPSQSTKTKMDFTVYRPPEKHLQKDSTLPAILFLSGLTCTAENVTTKGHYQKFCADQGLFFIAPDTSPRGANLPGEDDSYDLGTGAGFYINATESPWNHHYQMYDYINSELFGILLQSFPINPSKVSIMGHSMGGHGALISGLKNSNQYQSISAFSPICAPSQCPWGQKAFSHYLGNNQEDWKNWDANELVSQASRKIPILIDQGGQDEFLKEQLHPEIFQRTCKEQGHPLELNFQEGYDHSYYFISTFMEKHLEFHSGFLRGSS